MDFQRGRAKEDPEINLIPMIDVLLVILIFLMVTTTFSQIAELQINLPTAEADKPADKPAAINVAVDATGRYLVNGSAVTDADTAAFIQNFSAQLLSRGVVAHRSAHQADLALRPDPRLDLGPQILQAAFPGRAVDKPGGAEAAAPRAAPAGLHQKHLAPLA